MSDRRCKLGLRARIEIAEAVAGGETQRVVAARYAVSPATVNTIWQRWRAASEQERERGGCLEPRRPVPKSCPWALSPEDERQILTAREKTNWGPMRLQALTGRHRSTTWKVLKRHGCSRRRRAPKPERPPKRFEWAQPGALLHIDAFSVVKFDRPGHWATRGDRAHAHRSREAGKSVVIGVQDDHSRVVYAELHSAENARNVSACLRRAAAWFAEQGAGPVEAVLSDNAKCYATSQLFAQALRDLGARQILTPPYTPQWNGKLERFWQTLDTEWAHSRQWPNSTTRDRALASYLRFYNRRRPHSACGGRAPLTRVHQDREQDS
jgi:transposase InsO family protein